jgi:hypothetical protein
VHADRALFLGDFWRNVAATVMPGMAVADATEVRCLAAFAMATDGVVLTTPAAVMQSRRFNVIGHGAMDLHSEQLDLYLSTAPRRGRLELSVAEIVNPYIKVAGTLAAPQLAVDPRGVLFSGGAAVATAGISILAKGVRDRLFRAEDPCAAAAEEARHLAEGTQPSRKRLLSRRRSAR